MRVVEGGHCRMKGQQEALIDTSPTSGHKRPRTEDGGNQQTPSNQGSNGLSHDANALIVYYMPTDCSWCDR